MDITLRSKVKEKESLTSKCILKADHDDYAL